MCAAGSLNASAYGYPTLYMKIAGFFLSGIWLILNYTDNRAPDYPLIRVKYKFLIGITSVFLVEAYLQTNYFMDLRPEVITSCCGTLFSKDSSSVAGALAGLPPYPSKIFFYLSAAVTFRTGIHLLVRGKGALAFSYSSIWFLFFSLVSIISFISLYFYQLPTHHCPFCLIQGDYHYIGYPLYVSLLSAGVMGAGVGIIERHKTQASLREVIPVLQRRFCIASLVGYAVFTALSAYPILFSDFRLGGY